MNSIITSSIVRCAIVLILVCNLFGCVAKSPPLTNTKDRILRVPSAYSSKLQEAPSTHDWVKEISSDKILSGLIKEVINNNIDIKKAANNVQRAASTARISGSNKFPKFSGGVGGQRNQQAFLGLPFDTDDPQLSKSLFNAYGLSLDMQWEIDLWGRIKAGQEADIAQFEATYETLQGIQNSLAAQTDKIWFAILGSRQ